jgi:hypothetical protein
MLNTLTTVAGMVLLVSSFALAGQAPTKPVEQPKVAQSQQGQTNTKAPSAKKHHKHHKKHHAQAIKK